MALYKYINSINTFHKPFYGIYTQSYIHIDSRATQPYYKYLTPCYNYDWCCRYTCCSNNLVPICIDLSPYSKTDREWFEPNNLTEIESLSYPKMTSPRIYIKIYPPLNGNSRGTAGYIEEYILIPYKGIFKDKLRVWLTTSEGLGESSTYRVQYWTVHKAYYPNDYKRYCERVCLDTYREIEDTGSKRLLKEERWWIHQNYSCDPCNSTNDFLVDMKRKDDDTQDRDHNVDYIDNDIAYQVMDIKELNINGVQVAYEDYELVLERSKNQISPYKNDDIPVGLGVKWLKNMPPLGTKYTIRCSTPLDECQIIYNLSKKERYYMNL